jgi:hypothetical protein
MTKPAMYVLGVLTVVGAHVVGSILFSEIIFRDRVFACNPTLVSAVVAALNLGKKVAFATNDFPDKCIAAGVIQGWNASRDIVAIGSSRTMQVGVGLFDGRTFYNASVFAAQINDYLGLVELMERYDRLPRDIVIGVDPWSLDAGNEDLRWIGFAGESRSLLLNFLFEGGIAATRWIYLSQIAADVNKQVMASLKRLGSHLGPKGMSVAWEFFVRCFCSDPFYAGLQVIDAQDKSEFLEKNPDGTISYEPTFRLSQDGIEAKAKNAVPSYVAMPHRFSPELARVFWTLVDYLAVRKVKVTIWEAPYQVVAYDILSNSSGGAIVADVDRELRRGASARDVRVVGSYNPRDVGCMGDDFIDFLHPAPGCVARAFASWRGKW